MERAGLYFNKVKNKMDSKRACKSLIGVIELEAKRVKNRSDVIRLADKLKESSTHSQDGMHHLRQEKYGLEKIILLRISYLLQNYFLKRSGDNISFVFFKLLQILHKIRIEIEL